MSAEGRVQRASVFGVDEQRAVAVDVPRWVALAERVLDAERARPDAELSLLFVDEAAMAELNERHMAASGPTDVLAFPIDDEPVERGRWPDHGSAGPDRPVVDPEDLPMLLGDVVVCPAVAAAQAADHAGTPHHTGTVDDEIALLVVHGILHVLGMDHAEPAETETMQARERELLAQFHTS
ncbi:MAG: rRNA maturation RNase YbeY [Acidimicrobiales bacterium]|nr:rRNA maturation RNase YbeY [Acidimicrobiales bacterium]